MTTEDGGGDFRSWGIYLVSRDGRVFNRKGKALTFQVSQDGALIVRVIEGPWVGRGSKQTSIRAARLVMEAWVGKKPPGHRIGYRDGNPMNVAVDNLFYHPTAKLLAEQAKAAGGEYLSGGGHAS
jgi:hypothetical protein